MIYTIINNRVIGSYDDSQHAKIKSEDNLYWIDKHIPLQKTIGLTEEGEPITTPNTYALTYAEKVDSLRFERGWLLQHTDCGMVNDCPLSEDKKVELAQWRTDLRNFTQFVTEENIDTYTLPEPPIWAITWFKL